MIYMCVSFETSERWITVVTSTGGGGGRRGCVEDLFLLLLDGFPEKVGGGKRGGKVRGQQPA